MSKFTNMSYKCVDYRHFPGIMNMYIPPGQVYIYKCPTCGHETRIEGGPAIMC